MTGLPILARFEQDLLPFRVHVRIEFVQTGKAFFQPRPDLRGGEFIAFQRVFEGTYRRFLVVQIEIGHDKVVACQALVVGFEKFGIVRHHGAGVMVDGIVFVQIVAFTGEENEIHARVQQAFDVPVRELCGIAHGVAGDGCAGP